MIRKRQLLINALMSVVQVAVTGGSYFVLYRFVNDQVGIAYFGVWSTVLAATSVSSLANLGLATSAVKFVSMYLARERIAYVARIVQTAILSLSLFLGLVLAAVYPVLDDILAVFIEPDLLPVALSILPYSVASFWISSTAAVLQGCIDGHQRIDLRNALLIVTVLTYLLVAFYLVPTNGLVGLAQAQVLQAGLLLAASWIVLRRLLPALPLLPYRWDREAFKEMLSYSLKFQVISIFRLLFEPFTKMLVMNFGGAAAAGYFEFAHRMVFQLRALIVTAHQSIVPTIADLQERQPSLIQEVYKSSYRLILYLILASLPFFIAVTPLVSRLWIGSYAPLFILFANLIFIGWFLNMLSNPAYFAYLGIGKLRWNIVGHSLIGLLNGGLGLLLGWLYGGTGVVIAFVTALIAGSLTTAVAYQREYRIRLADLVQRESILLGLAGLAGLALALFVHDQAKSTWPLLALIAVVPASYIAVVAVPLWIHPARRQLQNWLTNWRARRSTET